MIQTTKVAHRTVKARDLDIFYREAGPKDAPAVLLLHGFPTSSQMFRNLILGLADRYRVLAPDYPGFGHNSMPPRDEFAYTFDNLVGSALAVGMFLTTLSFLVTTPGVWEPSAGGFPALSAVPGQFLIKDLALLGIALWTLGEAWKASEQRGPVH